MRIGSEASYPTVDEVIATLSRSQLPTLITEGRDDFEVFRRLEERCGNIGLSVLAVGGRRAVIELFTRRSELEKGPPIAFFADKDLWTITGVPDAYVDSRFLFTSGYSIENDIYADGELETLMTADERDHFRAELAELVKWYAFAVEGILRGEPHSLDYHPNHILKNGELCPTFSAAVGLRDCSPEMYDRILSDHTFLVRGKTLMSFLLRFLSNTDRAAKYSRKALLEIGVTRRGPLMSGVYGSLEALFGVP